MGRRNGRKSYFAKEHKKPKQKKNKSSYKETSTASSNQNRKQRQNNVTAQSIFAIADTVFGGNVYRHSADPSD